MMRVHILYALFLVIGRLVSAQNYPVSAIPDTLIKNSNAVVRDEEYTYHYISSDRNSITHRMVITVLNKNGDDDGNLILTYDKHRVVKSIHCLIYDAYGQQIRKVKTSEISDNSLYAGYAQFDDIRFKYFNPQRSVYPYTIEYEYEMDYLGSNAFPEWLFFEDYGVSIEQSVFRIITPLSYKVNWKAFNDCGDPNIVTKGDQVTYEWKQKGIVAVKEEPFEDSELHYIKAVYTAPSDFSLEGYDGNMNSWSSYAKWINSLNNGRDELPEHRVNVFRQMVAGVQNDVEKVKILYHYLQSNTRYFSISLGLGGLQPADAESVDKNGFGDCKGLTNYMKAMLKAVGIKSYYVIVEAGNHFPELVVDFPKHQFNHAMLFVPLKEDTIWLECTSQLLPFGFLGDHTSDRMALLIKENEGELVRTPAYNETLNTQNTYARIVLTAMGTGNADVRRSFSGLQYNDHLDVLYGTADEQRNWIFKYFKIPDYSIQDFHFYQPESDRPFSVVNTSLAISANGSVSGKRLFLPLNLLNRSTYIPEKLEKRRTNIRLTYPYIDTDTIEYILPEFFDVEYLPEAAHISLPFGTFDSYTEKIDNRVVYYRRLEIHKGVFSSDLYENFVKFFYDITIADKCQAVLIRTKE